jgi:FkbH-like protein
MGISHINLPVEPAAAITATFTSEPVEQPLAFWLQKLEMPARITFAPYNQVFQELLDSSSLLTTNRDGINVILVRLEDWQKDETGEKADGACASYQNIERNVRDLISALTVAAARSTVPYLVCLCPASPAQARDLQKVLFLKRMEDLIVSELDYISGVYVVTTAELAATYPVREYYDPTGDRLAHSPFTPMFYTALGTMIARRMYHLKNHPYKVIVLDGDQTLWNGICGEDGPWGVQIDPARKAIQEFMVQQHDAGMLLCLCSKNNEDDVVEIFERRTDMTLKRDHFAAWRVNWRTKSENIKSLAKELHLELDSMIFMDDDPVECAEVQANCSAVLTLQLPTDPMIITKFLNNLWLFDRLKITVESSRRTALYRQNKEREQFRKETLTLQGFLAGLCLNVEILPLTPHQVTRVSELTQRTNQFNVTAIKRTELEIQQFCRPDSAECFVVHVKDRFGDYGLVGLIIFKVSSGSMIVDTFLLSCRALGRGIEHQMLAKLGEVAKQRGFDRVDVPYTRTKRNQPAFDFLESIGADFKEPLGNGFVFRFPKEYAAKVSYSPLATEQDHRFPIEQTDYQRALPNSAVDTRAKAALLNSIATEFYDIEQIQKLILDPVHARSDLKTTFMAPRTAIEEQLAEMCSELLGIEQVGVNDSFFDLGGHSLLAMQVLSRVRDAFQIDLSPRLLFTTQFTVAELAKKVVKEQIQQADPEEIATVLNKLNTLSDDEVKTLIGIKASADEQSSE